MSLLSPFRKIIFNYTLLALVVFTMFFVTLFPTTWHAAMYDYLFTLIFLNAALTMEKHRKQVVIISIVIMALEQISLRLDLPAISFVSKAANIIFFIYIVINLIVMIASSKKVTAKVIIESITGYLLLGFVFTLLIVISMLYDPAAFKFPSGVILASEEVKNFSNYLYYGLVTLSTLGYGDVVPTQPFSKSLAVFTSIAGQLYIAIIIAMLVGKYAGQASKE